MRTRKLCIKYPSGGVHAITFGSKLHIAESDSDDLDSAIFIFIGSTFKGLGNSTGCFTRSLISREIMILYTEIIFLGKI